MSTALFILLMSAVFVIIGSYLWQKATHLLTHGKRADGIIFSNNFQQSSSGDGVYYPVVRFLTEKQEWITQELSIGYSPAKKVGSKVQVIYDPDDPTNLEINSTFTLVVLPRLLVALGVTGLIFGAFEYLEITQLLPQTISGG